MNRERGAISGEIIGEEFQRNEALRLGAFGFIDYAHPAAELFQEVVMRDGAAGQGLRVRRRAAVL